MKMGKKHTGITLLSLLSAASSAHAESGHLPNIIYILADDLGYGDLSCYGQDMFETPNIDRLAERGMLFTQHYAGCAVSAPSRSSLMSGLHTGHTSIRDNRKAVNVEDGQIPMDGSVQTIAEVLKSAGYMTGAFGKWGLGYVGSEGDPNNQGFDEFFGYNCQTMAHRYYPAYLWHNREKVELEGNDWTGNSIYSADLIQEKALEFIAANKDEKFFLFYPTTLPHAELIVPEDEIIKEMRMRFRDGSPYIGKGQKGENYGEDLVVKEYCHQAYPHATFAAMVTRLDRYVGEICNMLDSLGLTENTLIIFTSDNGPHAEGGADPVYFGSSGGFRGIKRDLYEGGIRVPMIASWPGHIQNNVRSEHLSAFWDVKSTLAELAGVEVEGQCDGISFLPELLGKEQKGHEYLYWEFHSKGGTQAVRFGDWKAVRLKMSSDPDADIQLYNLRTDPEEAEDLSSKYPEVVLKAESIMSEAHDRSREFSFEYENK